MTTVTEAFWDRGKMGPVHSHMKLFTRSNKSGCKYPIQVGFVLA